jgi:hypothetical protein
LELYKILEATGPIFIIIGAVLLMADQFDLFGRDGIKKSMVSNFIGKQSSNLRKIGICSGLFGAFLFLLSGILK